MAGGLVGFTLLDHGGESSGFEIHTGAITGVSLPGTLTQIGALRTAMDAITLGTISAERLTAFNTRLGNALPADANAQRERKWLVRYEDILPFFDDPVNAIPNEGFGKIFTFEIPTADVANANLLPNTDQGDLTDTQMAAFVTAFEAIARSPYGGTVNVLGMTAVGRNL